MVKILKSFYYRKKEINILIDNDWLMFYTCLRIHICINLNNQLQQCNIFNVLNNLTDMVRQLIKSKFVIEKGLGNSAAKNTYIKMIK